MGAAKYPTTNPATAMKRQRSVIRIDIDGDKARKADFWDMGKRIRAVDQGPDGSVYLLEDKGRLLRLDPATAR
jgi:glucose/arabinose dehydrogenase